MRVEVAVGGLLLVAGAATALMATDVAPLDLTDTVDVSVPMADATGLVEGAAVKVAGVAVGSVGDMVLTGSQAMVTLELHRDAKLRHNVSARVRMESLLGDKYVELAVSDEHPDAPLLVDGDVLDPAGPQIDLDELIDLLGSLLASIDPEDVGRGLEGLIRALEEDPDRLSRILANVDAASTNALQASQDLPSITGDVRVTLATARSTMRRLDARTDEAGHVLARADRVLGNLEAGSAPLPDTVMEAQRVLTATSQAVASMDSAAGKLSGTLDALDGMSMQEIERLLQEEGIQVRLKRKRDKKRASRR